MARAQGQNALYEVVELFKIRCLSYNKSLLWPNCSVWTAATKNKNPVLCVEFS